MKSFSEFIIENEHRRKTTLKMSPYHLDDVDRSWSHYKNSGKKPHTVQVHKSKIRATQSWIDKRYEKGKTYPTSSVNSPHPKGMMDKKGNVHLIDGHHRAEGSSEHVIAHVYKWDED